MASDQLKNDDGNEIDLQFLSDKIKGMGDSIGLSIFKTLQFIKKNIVILAALLIAGAVTGFFIDKYLGTKYKHEVILVPNFNSVDYLYGKIANMELKDSPIKKIEIEPVVNVYDFITDRWNNLEVAKYLSENNIDFMEFNKKTKTEQFYRYHLLTIYTKDKDENEAIVNGLLDELNQDPYFLERQKIEQANTKRTMDELSQSVDDMNKIFEKLGGGESKASGVSIETYSELNELMNAKKNLNEDISKLKIKELEQSKIIFDSTKIINVKDKGVPFTILLPIVLLLFYLGFLSLARLNRRYSSVS